MLHLNTFMNIYKKKWLIYSYEISQIERDKKDTGLVTDVFFKSVWTKNLRLLK